MAYRLTNTDKWGDAWFTKIKPMEKLLFNYLCDNCDIAGFIEINTKRWASDIGTTISVIEGALKGVQRGLIYSDTKDCIYLRTFLKHQKNLPINEKNFAHVGILRRFDLYSYKFNISNVIEFIEAGCKGVCSPLGNGNDKGKGKSKKNEFDYSFLSEDFKVIFNKWIHYKMSRNEMYKTQESLGACYNNLLRLSNNDSSQAQLIIDQAMGNNWAGLFPLKFSSATTNESVFDKFKVKQ